MTTVIDDINTSELNTVRRFLSAVRDEEQKARSPRGRRRAAAPLQARVARARGSRDGAACPELRSSRGMAGSSSDAAAPGRLTWEMLFGS